MIWSRKQIVALAVIGLLALALSPSTGSAQAPAAQDTLQSVIKRGELIVGTFDFFPPGASATPKTTSSEWTSTSPRISPSR